MHKLHSDTAIYSKQAAETLIKYVGVDNVLFSSEFIGAANAIDPETRFSFNDTKHYVDDIAWLTDEDEKKFFEGNAWRVYSRINVGTPA